MVGVEDLDFLGPHALGRQEFYEDAGQLFPGRLSLGATACVASTSAVKGAARWRSSLARKSWRRRRHLMAESRSRDGGRAGPDPTNRPDQPCGGEQLAEELACRPPNRPPCPPPQFSGPPTPGPGGAPASGIRETRGSTPAPRRSSTRISAAAPSRRVRPLARRMWSTSSTGVRQEWQGAWCPEPRTRSATALGPDRPRGAAPARRRRERPSESHSAVIWSIGSHLGPERRGWHGQHRIWLFRLPLSLPPPRQISCPRVDRSLTALVGDSLRPMDIEEFYDGDARRRPSAEIDQGLGTDSLRP